MKKGTGFNAYSLTWKNSRDCAMKTAFGYLSDIQFASIILALYNEKDRASFLGGLYTWKQSDKDANVYHNTISGTRVCINRLYNTATIINGVTRQIQIVNKTEMHNELYCRKHWHKQNKGA